MTVIWKSSEAAAAVKGMTTGDWSASGVSIDSRTVGKGDLFVAIRGPNTDGHLHVGDALAGGAAAAMVAKDWAEKQAAADMPLLIVADTDEGLAALARAARDSGRARVVAITGSVGKTSTKEALAHVLSEQAPTTATVGNLNNQWGLPLSMARMPAESIYGVFELGMNHAGELTPLSKLLQPERGPHHQRGVGASGILRIRGSHRRCQGRNIRRHGRRRRRRPERRQPPFRAPETSGEGSRNRPRVSRSAHLPARIST